MTILGRDQLNPKEADYKTILTKIKGMNPDAFYYGGVQQAAVKLARQAYEVVPKIHKLGSDGIYDSFNVSYRLRWGHPYPSRADTLSYISEVLERSIGRIEGREPSEEERYFYTLATLHEDMHAENLTLIQQTLG